jgi:hypothetical protein
MVERLAITLQNRQSVRMSAAGGGVGRASIARDVLAYVADVITDVSIASPRRVAVDGVTASGKTTFADSAAVAVSDLD